MGNKNSHKPANPFDAAESGTLTKKELRSAEKTLRLELLEVQDELRKADFPVLLLICGVDGAGKGDTANLLHEWVDPRGIATCAYGPLSTEEAERPEHWRFWRDLPDHGRMGIFLSAWYHRPLVDRAYGKIDVEELDRQLERIRTFEQTLSDDGALIIKLWLHLDKDSQERRLHALESDPELSWRVNETDWKHWRMYDRFMSASERIVRATHTRAAPWTLLDGKEQNWRNLRIGEILRDRMREHLNSSQERRESPSQPAPQRRGKKMGRLSALDLDLALDKEEYRTSLLRLQGRLNLLYRQARGKGVATVLVFEGWDASGKGGAIRRVSSALDARGYRVNRIGAPSQEELSHHYLWRFWRYLPRAGSVTMFDRSWYGRVLVERVEGFATKSEWQRAYHEINDFEQQLVDDDMVVEKFWMHISREEQERRFELRQNTPHKSWKLTHEDWRNRERWEEYEKAVEDMIELTGTKEVPWTLVESNDKRFARIKVLKTICQSLERALGEEPSS